MIESVCTNPLFFGGTLIEFNSLPDILKIRRTCAVYADKVHCVEFDCLFNTSMNVHGRTLKVQKLSQWFSIDLFDMSIVRTRSQTDNY